MSIQVVRKMLFESDLNGKQAEGWGNRMLNAIEVAKRLGFSNFEIDVTGAAAVESEEQPRAYFTFSIESVFGVQPRVEGDEWKDAEAPAKEEKKGRPNRVVRVWALIAVDVPERAES